MWTITLPLAVAVSKKKLFPLNLNAYRNAHYHTLNKAKVEFDRVVRPLLKNLPKLTKVDVEYVYYHGKGNVPDTNNVCSVADKFFADTLVNAGVLPDDGPKYRGVTTFKPGIPDPGRPRIEAIIRSTVPERKHTMKLRTVATLSPADVREALQDWFLRQVPNAKVDTLGFNATDDGGYEVHFEADAVRAQAPEKAARAPKQTQAPAPKPAATPEPQGTTEVAGLAAIFQQAVGTKPQGSLEPKPASTPSPSPGLFSFEPADSSSREAPAEEASTDAPAPPPPGKGLFAEFDRPSNK